MKKTKRILSVLLSLVLAVSGLAVCAVPASGAFKVGDHIAYGSYPGSKVSETPAIKAAANAATWKSYGYYSGNGSMDGSMQAGDFMEFADFFVGNTKYRAVKINEYRPKSVDKSTGADNTTQNHYGYQANTVYYFEYETLYWYVLNPDTGLIMCEKVIDAQPFHNIVWKDNNEYYGKVNTKINANNYYSSTISSWLKEWFYKTAFTPDQKNNIQTTDLTPESSIEHPYTIFLPSRVEASRLDADSRYAEVSDYAFCQGIHYDRRYVASEGYQDLYSWITRTPVVNQNDNTGNSGSVVAYRAHNGDIDPGTATYNNNGIRPACCLKELSCAKIGAQRSQNLYSANTREVYVTKTGNLTGSVQGAGAYAPNTSVTLTATGYMDSNNFDGWYENDRLVTKNNPYTFTLVADRSLEARFKTLYGFQAEVYPAGAGTITGTASYYAAGTSASATATANTGYKFLGWYEYEYFNSDYTVFLTSDATYTVSAMNANVKVQAKFEKVPTCTVTVKAGTGGTASGGGVVEIGKTTQLTATANSGYKLVGWYEGSTKLSGENPYTYTAAKNVTITAKFEKVTTCTVTVTAGTGGTASGGGVIESGKTTQLTATANSGYKFVGWYEGSTKLSGENPYTLTVTKDVTITAKFEPDAPPAINIRNFVKTKTVDYRTTLTLTAEVENPVSGAQVHWFVDGKEAGKGETLTLVQLRKDANVQAKYIQGGTILAETEIETVKVKSGFFAKLIAFFLGLFGNLPKIAQEYLGVEKTTIV